MTTPAIHMMTDAEARACVAKINAGLTDVRSLVYELYERQGWSTLGYASWRECVNAEFPSSQSYLYRQLEAAQTEKVISPTGENQIPERQLRPLTKLRNEPEKQRIAWQKAVSTAPDGKVTAALVAKIVKGMVEPEAPVKKNGQNRYDSIREHDLTDNSFRSAFDAFYKELQRAGMGGWKDTSRETARKYIRILLNYTDR